MEPRRPRAGTSAGSSPPTVSAMGPVVGLLTNCVDVLGMLAGLQHLGRAPAAGAVRDIKSEGLAGAKPLRVGLVYLDAHADYNTPETTLSGMLGGMDVAVAAGLCLTRLRLKVGLDPALPTKYIVLGGLRDVDPLEQELVDRSDVEFLTTEDLRRASPEIDRQMERLGRLTDVIYVHIDMDVVDPAEVRGHSLSVPEGPASSSWLRPSNGCSSTPRPRRSASPRCPSAPAIRTAFR